MVDCLAFQVAAEAIRPSAKVPCHPGVKVQVEVAQRIESKILVSEEEAIVTEGEKVAVPPAIRVEDALMSDKVFPLQFKFAPAII